jgi:hypothetical protein
VPRLPPPRQGVPLAVKQRPLHFSFFPVRRNTRRYGLNDIVFAVDPWAVIEGAVVDQVSTADQEESLAFIAQARAFFEAGRSRTPASPLLTYYAFLNLAKALIRCRGYAGSLDRAKHGLSDGQSVPAADLTAGTVTVHDTGPRVNVFAELIERMGYTRPTDATTVPVPELAGQIVVGHRLWREASNRSERFIVAEAIEFIDDRPSRQLWTRIWLRRGDLQRYNLTHARVIAEGGLTGAFGEVDSGGLTADPDLLCFEQATPVIYSGRPTDIVPDLVDACRRHLWQIVTSYPQEGYRRYYLHLTPPNETSRQPQVAAIWMLVFFFGSVVRYRPQAFATMTRGRYGAWINDFIAAQPEQLLYMPTCVDQPPPSLRARSAPTRVASASLMHRES